MESTSIYWIPIWRVLESYFELTLVNPYFIKQLPGKKSDVKDSGLLLSGKTPNVIKFLPGAHLIQASGYFFCIYFFFFLFGLST